MSSTRERTTPLLLLFSCWAHIRLVHARPGGLGGVTLGLASWLLGDRPIRDGPGVGPFGPPVLPSPRTQLASTLFVIQLQARNCCDRSWMVVVAVVLLLGDGFW